MLEPRTVTAITQPAFVGADSTHGFARITASSQGGLAMYSAPSASPAELRRLFPTIEMGPLGPPLDCRATAPFSPTHSNSEGGVLSVNRNCESVRATQRVALLSIRGRRFLDPLDHNSIQRNVAARYHEPLLVERALNHIACRVGGLFIGIGLPRDAVVRLRHRHFHGDLKAALERRHIEHRHAERAATRGAAQKLRESHHRDVWKVVVHDAV